MKGSNVLRLNEDTVLAALQHYFDNVLFKPGMCPKALSVTEETKSCEPKVFEVTVDTPQASS
jgi:hypothetical protein